MAKKQRPWTWPEAAEGSRLQRVNPGMFHALAGVKHFEVDGDRTHHMTVGGVFDWARKIARVGTLTTQARDISDAIRTLLEDGVLIEKDGVLTLSRTELEERIEIYNETP